MMRIALRKFCWLFFCALLLAGCGQPMFKPKAEIYYDAHGNQINLANYHGQWIALNYWASWCKPCWQEMPVLNQLYAQKKIMVLGVNYDTPPGSRGIPDNDHDDNNNAKLLALIQKMGIAFPVLTSDPKNALGIQHIAGLPTTVLINPQGKAVKILPGEQTAQSIQSAIASLS